MPAFRSLAACFAIMLLAPTGHDAWPQAARTIKIVVPFPPGGSADILARLLGEQISKAQGPTVVIENRPGGGASIAYEAVARAVPDGNTLVINGNSLVINPNLRKVNYDPRTSFGLAGQISARFVTVGKRHILSLRTFFFLELFSRTRGNRCRGCSLDQCELGHDNPVLAPLHGLVGAISGMRDAAD